MKSFFHFNKASQRRRKNRVVQLKDDSGQVITDDDQTGVCAVNYFRNLFTSIKPSGENL